MRPTTHRTALALAALTLLLAGCGTEAGSEGGGGSDSASPSPPPSASPSSSCTTVTGDLDASDSGDTVCLAVGDTVRISLDGTKDRPWQPVGVKGSGLEATNSGIVLLPGDASAAYKAVSAGHGTPEFLPPPVRHRDRQGLLQRHSGVVGHRGGHLSATASPADTFSEVVVVPGKYQRQLPAAVAVTLVLSRPRLSVVTVLTVL
ncbi:hypothetical protein M2161_006264 [Streptomyces sp. SAI-133]|nr:hypothetical protein [Streptomyces sp. SAI-133]